MILRNLTWPEVDALSREVVVLIPTGSCEQHGPHLPLFTDSILATAAAEAVEQRLPKKVLLTPTLWLGASGHHLAMAGTLSGSFAAYMEALKSVVESLVPHGFHKFYALNGHGGNTEPNGIALREMKAKYPNATFGHAGYFSFIGSEIENVMTGPYRDIRHACEAETSLIMHVAPDLVRRELLRDDGLTPEPPVVGVIHHFDEMSEQGSVGYATLATAEKGRRLFELAVAGCVREIEAIADGYVLQGKSTSQ
ncbi:MAG TPA: creatininase family protein [Fimbriimonadaceae bacterium]|nr:creatininase family protein [Fimbriimonadaceae bacterium]